MLSAVVLWCLAQPFLARNLDPAVVERPQSNLPTVEFDAGVAMFLANSDYGFEPWRTDGTIEGTQLVVDLQPGEGSSYVYPAGILRGEVVLNDRGMLWLSDGTPLGTRRILKEWRVFSSYFGKRTAAFSASADGGTSATSLLIFDGTRVVGQYAVSPPSTLATDDTYISFSSSGITFYPDDAGPAASQPGLTATESVLGAWAATPGEARLVVFDSSTRQLRFVRAAGSTAITASPAVNTMNSPSFLGQQGAKAYLVNGSQVLVLDDTRLDVAATVSPSQSLTSDWAGGARSRRLFASSSTSFVVVDAASVKTYAKPMGMRLLDLAPNVLTYCSGCSTATPAWLQPPSGPPSAVSIPNPSSASALGQGAMLLRDGRLLSLDSQLMTHSLASVWAKGCSSNPRGLFNTGRALAFTADVDGGTSLYSLVAPDAGLVTLHAQDVITLTAQLPRSLGETVLIAHSNANGVGLYRLTSSGLDALDDTPGLSPTLANSRGNVLLFSGAHASTGRELFVTDGTAEGTKLLADIAPGTASSNPESFVESGNGWYFTADDGVHGRELYYSDGTAVSMVGDLRPGPASSWPLELTAFADGGVLLVADDGTHGAELWRASVTGLSPTAELVAGAGTARPSFLIGAGPVAFFIADDGSGEALFSTDGTQVHRLISRGPLAGTRLVAAGARGRLLFAQSSDAGLEPYLADETSVRWVKELRSGADSSTISKIWAFDSHFYFAGSDGEHGNELFVSDGTAAGTSLTADIAPNALSATPDELTQVGKTVYFAATSSRLDRELWALTDDTLTDNTAPRVVAHLNQQPLDGWYREPVTISFEVNDPESTVTKQGCDTRTLETEGRAIEVACVATSEGGTTRSSVTLSIDTQPPTLVCPTDLYVSATEASAVTFDVTASDAVDSNPSIRANPPSGATFSLGMTPVSVTATDATGHSSACSFTVTLALPQADAGGSTIASPRAMCATTPQLWPLLALFIARQRRRL